jgi:hypothetical protein
MIDETKPRWGGYDVTSSYWRTIAYAAGLLACLSLTLPAIAALPPSASPAPAADYAQFRKLAKPLSVLDLLKASQHDLARTQAPLKDMPQKWHDTYDTVLARGIDANSDAVTDTIMHAAFVSFSHEEVERLSILAENSFLEKFQTAKINGIYDESADVEQIRQMLISDPDFLRMSSTDRKLMGRLIKATEGSQDMVEPMRPIVHAAVTEADATLDEP